MGSALCGPLMVEGLRQVGPVLWCFRCREHRMHYTVRMDEAEPGYYGPSWSQRCDRCDTEAYDLNGNPRFILERGA